MSAQKRESAKGKAPAKTTPIRGRSAGGARSKDAKKSSAPSRAREGKKRGRGRASKAKSTATAKKSTEPITPDVPCGRGRPKDTPDVWTPQHIEEVADQLWAYIEKTPCPTEAEFCYLHLVAHQRLGEFPILRELKEFMFAKRQAFTVGRGLALSRDDGPLGAFLSKLAANAGPYSLVDKSEFSGKIEGSNSRAAEMSPAERAKYLEEMGWKRQ